MSSLARKAGRSMLVAVSIGLAGALLLVGVLLMWSPGQPAPFVGADGKPLAGSLSEKLRVNLNGLEQGMFLKSKDVTNPVLLYLHGGLPDYFLTQTYPTGLEDHFTVAWWGRGRRWHYTALTVAALGETALLAGWRLIGIG